MDYEHDDRVVMTLDAGGTNFVFSAMRGYEMIVEPYRLPAQAADLGASLGNLVAGFKYVKEQLEEEPVAISFAFPGPSDYPKGVIGNLPNFPAYQGGVPLKAMLEHEFDVQTFINNDGNLFAYGEALAGFLPYINEHLEDKGSIKRYQNLIGITLGTGFGGGIVFNGELILGDNSSAAEVQLLTNRSHPEWNAEESISIRAIERNYAEEAGLILTKPLTPRDIYEIALGNEPGNRQAAIHAFETMAEVLSDSLANIITLIDGVVVVGGGLAHAHPLFFDNMLEYLNSSLIRPDGTYTSRLIQKVYNLEDRHELREFLKPTHKEIPVPGSDETVTYDPNIRTGIGLTRLGTSRAISIGAYCFALHTLDKGIKDTES